ncbi:sensor histidine kinase [Chitinimonas koreensis]|uniref:sensor histidine kinase n=1 Tax=Chitinimonas koreensis TaxID=356302 RepID=UPI000425B37D|nr:transporter substrate-binding domain-containing protein [Chitinimonas koreensis]QNM96672.1 transporter substrate-binding domain-containing protein [Chitinimonas koreensis]
MSPALRLCLLLAVPCLPARAEEALRVGVLLDPPYVQREASGSRLTGASVDLAELLARRMGRTLSWQVYDSPAALAAAQQAGRLDLAPLLPQTPAGLRYWRFSEPAVRVPVKLVARRGFRIGTLDELTVGYRVALRDDGPLRRFVAENYPALPRLGLAGERAALDAVVDGRADAALIDLPHAHALLGRGDYLDLELIGDAGYTLTLRVASRADRPELGRAVDAALARIEPAALAALQARWLRPPATPAWQRPGFWRGASWLLLAALLALGLALAWQSRQRRELRQQLAQTRRELEARESSEAALQLTQFSLDRNTAGVLWLGWDGRICYANEAVLRMHGHAAGQLLGQGIRALDPALDVDGWLACWHHIRQAGADEYETVHRCADGSQLPVDVRLSYLRYRDSEYLVAFVTDATERRRARAALLASEADLRELAAHIDTVREEEKARIAREVHDELGQVLTGLRLETSMAGQAAGAAAPALAERIGRMQGLIDQTFLIVRSIASELRPPILNAGLPAALDWLARRFEERYGLPTVVSVHGAVPALDAKTEIALFRIAQESLTNVARHAQAQTVRIDLTVSDGTLFLAIEDDGRGFAPDPGRPASFGLIGMRERAMAIGGSCMVESREGEGTDVTVRLPIVEKGADLAPAGLPRSGEGGGSGI